MSFIWTGIKTIGNYCQETYNGTVQNIQDTISYLRYRERLSTRVLDVAGAIISTAACVYLNNFYAESLFSFNFSELTNGNIADFAGAIVSKAVGLTICGVAYTTATIFALSFCAGLYKDIKDIRRFYIGKKRLREYVNQHIGNRPVRAFIQINRLPPLQFHPEPVQGDERKNLLALAARGTDLANRGELWRVDIIEVPLNPENNNPNPDQAQPLPPDQVRQNQRRSKNYSNNQSSTFHPHPDWRSSHPSSSYRRKN